jgi:ABC-2 type transport system permease protein
MPLPDALSEDATRKGIEEGLKRFASGLMKSVALATPAPPAPPPNQFMPQPQGAQFTQLRDFLASDFDVESADLGTGALPGGAEMLVVVDPENLDEKAVFAVDQFLMRGGTVVLSTAPFDAALTQQSLTANPQTTGLEDWLAHHGVTMPAELVMDPQSGMFPVPVTRQVGGFSFQDLAMISYPYFVDVRPDAMADMPFAQGVPQVTVPWASPIELAEGVAERMQVTELLRSSEGSWVSDSTDVIPRFDEQGISAFLPEGEVGSRVLAVAIQGRFDSYFAGRNSPLLDAAPAEDADADAEDSAADPVFASVIEKSPESARLFIIGSNGFLADQTLRMVGAADGMFYTNSVQLMANLVDWALEDDSLTGIRARGNFNRTLPPMDAADQSTVEYLNYLLALLGVLAVYLVHRQLRARRQKTVLAWMQGGAA